MNEIQEVGFKENSLRCFASELQLKDVNAKNSGGPGFPNPPERKLI
jgi:hypothetical protein